MKYCSRCVLPDTRPNLTIGADGVCNACAAHESRLRIDWSGRERLFHEVVDNARSRSEGYDCLIPVSGGKDSTWQVIRCLEYGLKPLAVTWAPPARTEVGERNLRNLIGLGVDHIDYRISPDVEKKFMAETFRRAGSSAIPMHMALFAIPLNLAVAYKIPLVVWGENSAFEYGGTEEERTGFRLDAAWLGKFGVTQGTTPDDWIDDDLTRRDLTPYFAPTDRMMETSGTLAIFLGYYFPWDPAETYRVAREHGFAARDEGAKTGYYDFADIDDDFISIHHYLKWYKFGFTRDFDNLSIEIRHGRMARREALSILRGRGAPPPVQDIARFCEFTGMTEREFFSTAERFRNHDIWYQEGETWKVRNFLIPDWKWDAS